MLTAILAQANPSEGFAVGAFIMMGLAAMAVFAPIIIVATNSRNTLGILAIVLCLAGAAGTVTGIIASLGGIALASIRATLWLGGLMIGLASFLDSMADKRARETAWRLIHGADEGISTPKAVKAARRG
jgi:hypothetical protein